MTFTLTSSNVLLDLTHTSASVTSFLTVSVTPLLSCAGLLLLNSTPLERPHLGTPVLEAPRLEHTSHLPACPTPPLSDRMALPVWTAPGLAAPHPGWFPQCQFLSDMVYIVTD